MHGLRSGLDLVSMGTALTVTLVGLSASCAVAAVVWPDSLAHGWLALFAFERETGLRGIVRGIIGSAASAWITAFFFVTVYNHLAARRDPDQTRDGPL